MPIVIHKNLPLIYEQYGLDTSLQILCAKQDILIPLVPHLEKQIEHLADVVSNHFYNLFLA